MATQRAQLGPWQTALWANLVVVPRSSMGFVSGIWWFPKMTCLGGPHSKNCFSSWGSILGSPYLWKLPYRNEYWRVCEDNDRNPFPWPCSQVALSDSTCLFRAFVHGCLGLPRVTYVSHKDMAFVPNVFGSFTLARV